LKEIGRIGGAVEGAAPAEFECSEVTGRTAQRNAVKDLYFIGFRVTEFAVEQGGGGEGCIFV
jgi:hypothetical protein